MHQGWCFIACMWLATWWSFPSISKYVLIGLLFVISGFGGSLLSALFIHSNFSFGASDALFGLLGGMLSELITNWSMYDNKFAAFFTLVIIIVINLAIGILPHVDNFSHIGGFLTGFLLGFAIRIHPFFQNYQQSFYTDIKQKHHPSQADCNSLSL